MGGGRRVLFHQSALSYTSSLPEESNSLCPHRRRLPSLRKMLGLPIFRFLLLLPLLYKDRRS